MGLPKEALGLGGGSLGGGLEAETGMGTGSPQAGQGISVPSSAGRGKSWPQAGQVSGGGFWAEALGRGRWGELGDEGLRSTKSTIWDGSPIDGPTGEVYPRQGIVG